MRQVVQIAVADRMQTVAIATRAQSTDPEELGPVWEVCDRRLTEEELARLIGPNGSGHSITIPQLDLTVPMRLEHGGTQSFRFRGTWMDQQTFEAAIKAALPP